MRVLGGFGLTLRAARKGPYHLGWRKRDESVRWTYDPLDGREATYRQDVTSLRSPILGKADARDREYHGARSISSKGIAS